MERYLRAIIPNNWKEEKGENTFLLYDPVDGVGALQVSSYKAIKQDSMDLGAELKDYLGNKHDGLNITKFSNCAYCTLIDEDGVYWRYWLISKINEVLFASYNCDQACKGQEDGVVDDIMKSLTKI
jgi:hypothetical protein